MTRPANVWAEWLTALAVSLALNVLMFGALPGLMQRETNISSSRVPIQPINFVRLKHETPPITRKPPPPQKQKPARAAIKKPRAVQLHKRPQLTLPYQPSRVLPMTAGAISVPLAQGLDPGLLSLDHEWGLGDLDQPLTPLVRIPPVYPLRAKRMGIEGWVRVKFLVRRDGTIARAEILEAAPAKLFDSSVRRCVTGWRFRPGTVDGEPVDVWAETVIRFKLD